MRRRTSELQGRWSGRPVIRLSRPTHCRHCGKRLKVEDRYTANGGIRCGVLRYCPNEERHGEYFYGPHDIWDKHAGLWWARL